MALIGVNDEDGFDRCAICSGLVKSTTSSDKESNSAGWVSPRENAIAMNWSGSSRRIVDCALKDVARISTPSSGVSVGYASA